MANGLTALGRNATLEEMPLTMSRATVLDLAAAPMTCAGIGGAKDSVTYLNIPISSMHNVLVAS